jgi:hypothetical protein
MGIGIWIRIKTGIGKVKGRRIGSGRGRGIGRNPSDY